MAPVSMEWHDVLFCHWAVPPSTVRGLVPDPLAVDVVDGSAWVGLISFRMVDLRHARSPLSLSFPQLNARTYVRLGDRRGTYFFSLDAPERLVVWLGRREGLPYFEAETRLRTDGDRRTFGCRRTGSGAAPASYVVDYEPEEDPAPPEEGSLRERLAGVWRYFCRRDGRVLVGEVDREPFSLAPASVDVDLNRAFPTDLEDPASPDHCWVGSPVRVEGGSTRPAESE